MEFVKPNPLNMFKTVPCPAYCTEVQKEIILDGREMMDTSPIDIMENFHDKLYKSLEEEEYFGEAVLLSIETVSQPHLLQTVVYVNVGLDNSNWELWSRWENGV